MGCDGTGCDGTGCDSTGCDGTLTRKGQEQKINENDQSEGSSEIVHTAVENCSEDEVRGLHVSR
jgi:hypothetical protein